MADPAHTNTLAPLFLNGRLVPSSEARLFALHHGVMNGIGFYETFRTSGGRPHLWAYHRARLEQACARVGIEPAVESLLHRPARLHDVTVQMLRDVNLPDAVFRYTLHAGGADPVRTTVTHASELLTMRPIPAAPPAEGICLHVLNSPRDSGEWVPRPKSINQLNAQLGTRELHHRAAAPADEGLFLSRGEGFVVETTRQNIAWIREGELCYPDPTIGAVAGTCLAWVLDRAIPARPCRVRLDALAKADAVVVMNSVRGITPVREIRDGGDRVLVTGIPSHENPLVVSLRRQWAEALVATAQAE
jgi:4-amino-4-deoxychorismate lyase